MKDEAKHVFAKQERRKRNINEAMAKLEYESSLCSVLRSKENETLWVMEGAIPLFRVPDDYTSDHNAVQRLTDGLEDELMSYHCQLISICGYDKWAVHKATALQKCEAILRAKGLWIEEDAE